MKHSGGSVMAWACVAAIGAGSLIFIHDVNADQILSAHIHPDASELIGMAVHSAEGQ